MTHLAASRLLTRLHLQPCTVERYITATYGALLARYYAGERTYATCHAAAKAERVRRAAGMVRKMQEII